MGRIHRLVAVVGAYIGVALVFFWPLPLHLTTKLTGPVGDDTGIYVWNLWHFRHQVLRGRPPFFTDVVLSLTQGTDLSLHNYTAFADILAFPLIPLFGLTATFNIICIGLTVLTAVCTYLLALRTIGRAPEAWLTGAAFAFSPVLVTRSTGHFSLVAAAPLPVFVLCRLNAGRTRNLWWGWGAGAAMAWAVTCDPYYGIVCIIAAACFLCVEWLRIRPSAAARTTGILRALDLLAVSVAGFVAFIVLTGGAQTILFGHQISMRTLHTPVLTFAVLIAFRLWITWRPRATFTIRFQPLCVGRFALAIAAACAVVLSPMLPAFAYRLADGGMLHKPIYWRSSPPGVDLLALFMPNPNHPLFGAPWRLWLSSATGDYLENVSALTIVAISVVIVAVWRLRFRPPVLWVTLAVLFTSLALGPFVHVGGVNTYLPGPWAFLRYTPLISAARTPARFAIPAMLAFSMLFGLALRHMADRDASRRRLVLTVVALVLFFELLPAPRVLYSAEVPAIYKIIAEDPRDIRVLHLPFGIRDGESSIGNFSPSTQYYQTYHQKRLIGAYLSRISSKEIERQRRTSLTLRALVALSEGRPLSPEVLRLYKARGPRFIQRARLGYVVVSEQAAAPLRQFAIEAFGLVKVGEGDGLELFEPSLAYQRRVLTLASLDPRDPE